MDRWRALSIVAVAVLGACGGGAEVRSGQQPSPSTTGGRGAAGTTSTSTTQTTTPTTTTTTAPEPPPPPPQPVHLRTGSSGAEVRELQRRLESLHYWIGPVDGSFGNLTEQAVYAFQKAQGIAVDGVVGPETRAALAEPRPVVPRSSRGLVWEVDKTRQLAFVVRNGQVDWVWNTSTGTEQPYTYDGRQLLADTPNGRWSVFRQVDGWDSGPLGDLYRPRYFHEDGIALHGFDSVPPVPASHGCVRLTIPAINFVWVFDLAPIGTPVWVYGTTPR